MKKLIIKCSNCKKKMRILNKPGKYKCPSCEVVQKISRLILMREKIKNFFLGIKETGSDMRENIIYKYNSTKNTYKYMKQVKKNMKDNPNWSNYKKEQDDQKEMRDANKKSFRNIFRKKK